MNKQFTWLLNCDNPQFDKRFLVSYRMNATWVPLIIVRTVLPSIFLYQGAKVHHSVTYRCYPLHRQEILSNRNMTTSACVNEYGRFLISRSNPRVWNLPIAITKWNCYRHPDFSKYRFFKLIFVSFPLEVKKNRDSKWFFLDEVICKETERPLTWPNLSLFAWFFSPDFHYIIDHV